MKPSAIAAIVLLIFAAFGYGEEEPAPRLKITALKTPVDFAEHLPGPAKWQVGQDILTLKMDGDSTVCLRNGSQEVFRLNNSDYVSEAVQSEDGTVLIFAVMKSERIGSDYQSLLKITSTATDLKPSPVLESTQKLFDGRRWWIRELGAVSNDGTRLLANFGVDAPDSNRTRYTWYTIELTTSRILSEGLSMENSKSAGNK